MLRIPGQSIATNTACCYNYLLKYIAQYNHTNRQKYRDKSPHSTRKYRSKEALLVNYNGIIEYEENCKKLTDLVTEIQNEAMNALFYTLIFGLFSIFGDDTFFLNSYMYECTAQHAMCLRT